MPNFNKYDCLFLIFIAGAVTGLCFAAQADNDSANAISQAHNSFDGDPTPGSNLTCQFIFQILHNSSFTSVDCSHRHEDRTNSLLSTSLPEICQDLINTICSGPSKYKNLVLFLSMFPLIAYLGNRCSNFYNRGFSGRNPSFAGSRDSFLRHPNGYGGINSSNNDLENPRL